MSARVYSLFLIVCVFAVAAFVGCSGDAVVTPTGDDGPPGIVSGEIGPTGDGFEIEIRTASSGEPDRHIVGPFILEGTNIHYDDSLGALVVDLSVTNRGRDSHPEPIGLTFVVLLPPGVTVLNSDNGENGPGAAIVFQFENDDGMWTPGEKSLPRTVHFGVNPATSIGFVARLDVGMDPNLGAIGGTVWLDANKNGEMDPGEHGIGGVEVFMTMGDREVSPRPEALWRTLTAPDGTYRFGGLRAGFYTVFKGERHDLLPTTPAVIQVVLVEIDGRVGDFLMANFGCVFRERDLMIQIGDYIRASGTFVSDPNTVAASNGALVAREVVVTRCGERGCVRPGSLAGPVTEVDRVERALRIMADWVSFAHMDSMPDDSTHVLDTTHIDLDPDSVEVGDRVHAGVFDSPDGADDPLRGFTLFPWNEPFEQAVGYVKRIGGDPSEPPAQLVILRQTLVIITEDTRIEFRDD